MTAGRKSKDNNKDWGTPPKYAYAIEKFFGTIHLDPCSNPYSIINAVMSYCSPEQDGLSLSWNFPTIYCNPPYGRDYEHGTSIKHWLSKCEEANRLHKSEVIALVPVATNTSHWKMYVFNKATAICFLYDTRLKFWMNGTEIKKGAPMACALIYWGKYVDRFIDTFKQFGFTIKLN